MCPLVLAEAEAEGIEEQCYCYPYQVHYPKGEPISFQLCIGRHPGGKVYHVAGGVMGQSSCEDGYSVYQRDMEQVKEHGHPAKDRYSTGELVQGTFRIGEEQQGRAKGHERI